MGTPTLSADKLPITYRGTVAPSEIDEMGHMNVRYYVQKAGQAAGHLLNMLGMGPDRRKRLGLIHSPLDHHVRFLKESHLAMPINARSGIISIAPDCLRIYTEILHGPTGAVSATFTGDYVLTHGLHGERANFPKDVLAKAKELLCTLPDYGAPRGINLPTPTQTPNWQEAERLDLAEISRLEVGTDKIAADGAVTPEFFIGTISDGIPAFLSTIAIDRAARLNDGVGGAALEYRLFYFRRPEAGELTITRSGFIEVGNKTFLHGHWIFDQNGKPLASIAAIAVSFDLKARKALPMPPEMRAAYEEKVVKGFVV